jgi:2-polyprenyl-6-methoxyphenol hydroxylase-like FAD-dependent oxidoreductase
MQENDVFSSKPSSPGEYMSYDVIVVGARCAGSPTAMLLARKGYKVLAADRATFPSDTISTHLIHPPGVACLTRWGLKDRVAATGCPPIDGYTFDLGPFALAGSPGTSEEPASYAPRRTVLDKILIDAAAEAGVEVREAFTVDEILRENGEVTGIRGHSRGGERVTERAKVVIGADGRNSSVARQVEPEQYNERPIQQASYYSYWSGLPLSGFEAYSREDRAWAAWPTNDGLTLIVGGWPYAQFEEHRKDPEGTFMAMLDRAPEFAERVRHAKREERFLGAAVPNFFRKPFGPGWALVGDAGYNKDFITAQGISDAFRDAELCVDALDAWFSGRDAYDQAMTRYQTTRDTHVFPIYNFTIDFASLAPPPPQQLELMAAIHGNQEAMDGFARVISGVTSPAAFFSEENVGSIFAAAAAKNFSGPLHT